MSQPPTGLDVTAIVEDRLAELAREDPRHELERIVLLGDSTSVPVPERLQDALANAAPLARRARVSSLAILGQTTFDEYFLSEAIARAHPDAVVIAVHLAGFSDAWRRSFAKPEFAGWLPPGRWLEALRLPLHWVGLSTDELLWYGTLVASGQAPAWRAWCASRCASVRRRATRSAGLRRSSDPTIGAASITPSPRSSAASARSCASRARERRTTTLRCCAGCRPGIPCSQPCARSPRRSTRAGSRRSSR